MLTRVVAAGASVAWLLMAGHAQAQAGEAPAQAATEAEPAARDDSQDEIGPDGLSKADLRIYRSLSKPRGGYARVFGGMSFGRGLRFNNPYRLATQLGDTPESLSLTAPYMDLAVGTAFGEPDGLQHGAVFHAAFALEGVSQQALSLSYAMLVRGDSPWLGYARLGAVMLTAPDPNVGGELAVGGAYFLTGALGLTSELVADLFYGAGTYEAEFTVIPTLSWQAGVMFDFEVLP